MDFYFHLILLVFLVSSGKVLSQENIKIKRLLDKHGSSLIVGGYPVTEGDIPYQVSLRELDRHFCGGTIISELFILTAGHCLENKSPSEMSVFGGAVLLKSKSGSVVPVRRISIHPSYDNVTLLNDIGILELDYKLEFSRTLKSIEISRSQFSEGSKCQVSGWGYISEKIHKSSRNLKAVTIFIKNSTRCFYNYSLINEFYDIVTMFCASDVNGDACQGDSGGPVTCDGVLVGITSWGTGCGMNDFPGVYTNVSYYRDWIDENSMLIGSNTVIVCQEKFLFICFVIIQYIYIIN